MNFTVKTLVAAAALVAAGSANAAIVNFNSTTGSDVFLAVYDFNSNVSSIFDLGNNLTFSSIANGTATSQSIDLSSDSSWTSLFTKTTAANLSWGIVAGVKPATNKSTLLETYSGTPVDVSSYKQNSVYAANTALTNFFATASNATYGLTTGGSIFTTGNTGAPFVGAILGSVGAVNATGSTVVNALDTFANIVTYTNTLNSPTAGTSVIFDSQVGFKLSSAGVLTYTALPVTTNVPETDTFAMLLAGLGVMGFVARRRLVA